MKFHVNTERKKDPEIIIFSCLLAGMAVYYGYRMFALTPWYVELYTYYYFISRGPVYAAIHWPVPNNHVGYSVLSAFLDFFGNPYIGLRGVSYLCALINMVLLFLLGRRYFKEGISLAVVSGYCLLNLVNQLSVQGRGYTLSVTCFLTAVSMLDVICREEWVRKKTYVFFALSLVLGLYTVPSDVYWVIPVCLSGGIYLLLQAFAEKRSRQGKLTGAPAFQRLIRLILVSLLAAFITICLYGIIWLAIGSNLLIKEDPAFQGTGHVQMILRHPFICVSTGIDYMLATPYIQSVPKEGFLTKLVTWLQNLFIQYLDGSWWLIPMIVIGDFLALGIRTVTGSRKRRQLSEEDMKDQEKGEFTGQAREKMAGILPLLTVICTLAIPLFLLVQHKLPYYRVFMYGGALIALLLGFFLDWILPDDRKKAGYAAFLTVAAFGIWCFTTRGYQNQYSDREHSMQEVLAKGNIEEAQNVCVTDCTQQYLIRFLYGITCENQQIEGSDFLLLDRRMADPDFTEMEWEFYHYYNTIPWDYVNTEMEKKYENQNFILYTGIREETK